MKGDDFLQLTHLEVLNFGSYHGQHEFDFTSPSGQFGYAIFGEIGRGKTTVINAIMWGLYGEVEASVELEGKIHTKPRPIFDSNQIKNNSSKKWNLPLLNLTANDNNDYHMSVSITFEHKGSSFKVFREAKPKNSGIPKKNSDLKMQTTMSINGRSVPGNLIQSEIEQIIPKRISKFFFVEVDSIKSYSALLFAGEASQGIVNDIEAILGMPALEHSRSDFKWISDYQENRIEAIETQHHRNEAIAMTLKSIDKRINEMQKHISGYEADIQSETQRIKEIELELEEHPSAESQIKRLKEVNDDIKEDKSKLAKAYASRRTAMSGDAWRMLLQPKVESLSEHYSNLNDKKTNLESRVAELKLSCEHINHQIRLGSAECKVCGHVAEGLSPLEREEKAAQLVQDENEIEQIRRDILILGNPSADLIFLSRFRDSRDSKGIADQEELIARTTLDLSDNQGLADEIQKEMQESDVISVQNLQNEKIQCIERRGSYKTELDLAKAALKEERDLRAETKSNMNPVEVDSPLMVELKSVKSLSDWLESVFEQTLQTYKDNARDSVQGFATKAWLNMIPEPEKYRGITIDSKWQTQVISKGGKSLPIGNPGHRQTLAVCIFDGLRKTSGRKFPTFYDNPGSNISDVVLARMADHFWNNTDDQIVMLSHGGGLKKAETMSRYGDKLAKAWELSYSQEGTSTIISEVVE